MDFYSCIARRTRHQWDLEWMRQRYGSSSGSEGENTATGSGSSSRSRREQGKRTRLESLSSDPIDAVSILELSDSDSGGRRRKGRNLEKRDGDSDVVFVGECMDEEGGGSENVEVIVINSDEEEQNEVEIKKEPSEAKPVTVKLGTHREDGEERGVKVSNVGGAESDSGESDSDPDDDVSSTDSESEEDDDSRDEDFKVGDSEDDGDESSDEDDDSNSYEVEKDERAYGGDDDDETEEEDDSLPKGACGKKRKEKRRDFDEETFVMLSSELRKLVAEEQGGKKVETESSGIFRKNGDDDNDNTTVHDSHREKKGSETVSPTSLGRKAVEVEASSEKHYECGGENGKEKCQKEWEDVCFASVIRDDLKKNGCSAKLCEEAEAKNVEKKKQEVERLERIEKSLSAGAELFGDNQESFGCSKPSEDEARGGDKVKQEGIVEEDDFDILFNDVAKRVEDGPDGWEQEDDNAQEPDARPPASEETLQYKFTFGKKAEPVEKSESDKELDGLWEQKDHFDILFNDVGKRVESECTKRSYKIKEGDDKGASVRAIKEENIEDSDKNVKIMEKKKEREANKEHDRDGVNKNNGEKKPRVDKETGGKRKVRRVPARPKQIHLMELLAECFGKKPNASEDDSDWYWAEQKVNNAQEQYAKPVALEYKFSFGRKAEPVEKSESEKELDMLWEQMGSLLRFEEINSQVGNAGINEAGHKESPTTLCKHDFYLDEEIGIICRYCSFIATEIKYVSPPVEDNFPYGGSGIRSSSSRADASLFDGVQFDVSGCGSEAVFFHNEGTVWDLIPDIKESMYPHQREGFEFIWTNLAGTIDLHELKSADPRSSGGCIISHAPGTGKTRLTIMFLLTYLQVFPECKPIIIAPANILLTWEDEFKKWGIGIPFHNLNNLELSGKENVAAVHKVDMSRSQQEIKNTIRAVKLVSWCKQKSILGISYPLYEKFARKNSKVDEETEKKKTSIKKEKKHARMKRENSGNEMMGQVLHDNAGLLVLDEGHTPRNRRSLIWNVLSETQVGKRIILSGTPFQNNFEELYNVLFLVKPSFPDTIPQELKKFCQSRLMQERKASRGMTWEPISPGSSNGNHADGKIHQLKLLMDPFVHVHKGSVLQKNLPGLRECVVTLKPENLQKAVLESIESSQNPLKFERKLTLASIHPSLFFRCPLSTKEASAVDKDQLEELKLNPYAGVKTRFLVEFVRMCEAVNEKVLVFSQFIDPLRLIIDQLKSVFDWSEGKEVLYMHGKLDQKQRQFLIHSFNDANSLAKILLASTKACSEGINLVGASRVVLMDVVWNPSVERQAISRAYRLGQKRVVYTYLLIIEGTAESVKYGKQAEKDRISELVFSARNTEDGKQKNAAVVSEDKVLDQMVQHDKLKDMFVTVGYSQRRETCL